MASALSRSGARAMWGKLPLTNQKTACPRPGPVLYQYPVTDDAMQTTNATSRSTAADRTRVYRQRRAEGRHVASVEVGREEIEALVENGLLDAGDVADRDAISLALGSMLFALSEGAIEIDFDRFIEAVDESG